MKIGMIFQEITSITEFPGSNFLLPGVPTIQTGSKSDFQVANLLLATVNFEPCDPTPLPVSQDRQVDFHFIHQNF